MIRNMFGDILQEKTIKSYKLKKADINERSKECDADRR